jgi:hypothetical protein
LGCWVVGLLGCCVVVLLCCCVVVLWKQFTGRVLLLVGSFFLCLLVFFLFLYFSCAFSL